MRAEPWSMEDLVAVGRLAATDFSWRVWHRLLRLRRREDWPQIWQRLMREGFVPSFSGAGSGEGGPGAPLLAGLGRGGSNSFAIAAGRSATGAALIASDPHLPIALPNLWLIAGMKSPGYHAVGLMIPGVPVVALGRNPWIGWGGTSLHAASSDLIDVTGLPDDAIAERRERIRVRWGKAREITVRETPYGPIISDVSMLDMPAGRRLALRWIGHRPNDEITAMLRLARARDWDGFMDAIDGFAVPAQNMIYADREGRVGQAMAAHLPRRPQGAPTDLVVGMDVDAHWRDLATAKHLPSTVDPAAGFVASANDRPDAAAMPVGFFFSPDERVDRLRSILGAADHLTVEDLQALQRDVSMPSSLPLRDALLRAVGPPGMADADVRRLCAALRDWDGRHTAESAGALAFEVLIHHFLKALHGERDFAIYSATWDALTLLGQDLATLPADRLSAAAREAARRAARVTKRHRNWGDIHRLRLSHGLSILPGSGRRYRFADLAVGGGNETVMKTAYGLAAGRHAVRLGANARHVSDLSDLDANRFVLLGGQDGWLGSTTFLDQLPLWRNGDYIAVPMRPETVRRDFRRLTVLSPKDPAETARTRPARS
jgi:penicillin amidase